MAFAAIMLHSGSLKPSGPSRPLEVVPSVDLARYAGTWHEIARLPNFFQHKCAGEITAIYTLRPDGKVTVVNACRKQDGSMTTARGTARVADKKGPNSKLKVTFFWPFSGNYWIIDLDPEYQWVAVGEPDRKYFWILSRTPQMDESVIQPILERARTQGYDLTALIRSAPPPPSAR